MIIVMAMVRLVVTVVVFSKYNVLFRFHSCCVVLYCLVLPYILKNPPFVPLYFEVHLTLPISQTALFFAFL